jgi:heptosyltransferase-3
MQKRISRILVFRQGSIGDFVVALPCFHLIRRCYPNAEVVLLTNEPDNPSQIPAESILAGTALVDGYLKYPGGTRDFSEMRRLRQEIHGLAPETLAYLAPSRGATTAYRDYLFFRWCGLRRIVGIPKIWDEVASCRLGYRSGLWESEAHRLARRLATLGEIDVGLGESWELHLTANEMAEAARLLDGALAVARPGTKRRLLGLSVGTKQPVKDWGDLNWGSVLRGISSLGFDLVLLGGKEDWSRSEKLAEGWPSAVLNLCGRVSPRVSAAVLRHVRAFLCHDSGPMHLAAAVGTRCVAVFSPRTPPGKWFPCGADHTVFYPGSRSATIHAIRPQQVTAATVAALETPGMGASRFLSGAG